MGFWLKKVVSYWLMPMPFALLLLALGVFLLLRQRRGAGRFVIATGGLWLVVLSNNAVGTALISRLERQFAPIPELIVGAPLPAGFNECRLIVVLGGGHSDLPDTAALTSLSSSATARVAEGVRLARALPEAKVVFSGARTFLDRTDLPTHAHVLATAAISLGLAPGRIVELGTARDTEDEARLVSELTGPGPVALVTSAWHLPRATALFAHQGIKTIACPTDYLSRPGAEWRLADYGWDVGGLERSTRAIREYLGQAWVSLRRKG